MKLSHQDSEARSQRVSRPARRTDFIAPVQSVFWLMVLTVVAMTVVIVWWAMFRTGPSKVSELSLQFTHRSRTTVRTVRTGLWGTLTVNPRLISPPMEFVEDTIDVRPVAWIFPGHTEEHVLNELRRFGFEESQIAEARSADWQLSPGGVAILPPDDLVISLSQDTRNRLYNYLGDFPANSSFRFTIVLTRESWDQLLESSQLPSHTLDLIRRLLYQRGTRWLLTDIPLVARSLPTAKQRLLLGQMLSSSETLGARLQVRRDTDLGALIEYWSHGQNVSDIRPLLESLVRVPAGASIDLIHLLPSFPRRLLYTYPLPVMDRKFVRQDCHWTSMNFFNAEPDDRFMDPTECERTIRDEYETITDEPKFGDLVVIFENGASVIHSAVYIAAGIVFTKNGGILNTPWMLMELQLLLDGYGATYNMHGKVEARFMRRKVIPVVSPPTSRKSARSIRAPAPIVTANAD